jgi:hypothetical protein
VKSGSLLSETQFFDDGSVAFDLGRLEVIEKPAALANHFEKAPSAMVVFLVDPEVLGQILDLLGEKGDLDLRRAGIVIVESILVDYLTLGVLLEHLYLPTFLQRHNPGWDPVKGGWDCSHRQVKNKAHENTSRSRVPQGSIGSGGGALRIVRAASMSASI